jgi:hypothetical protein
MTERIRSSLERRSGADRRKGYRLGLFVKGKIERRGGLERRAKYERRKGWVRVGKWRGVRLEGLMISKFLRPRASRGSSKAVR